MLKVEDVVKALELIEDPSMPLIPEKVWRTLVGGDELKPEKIICVICGNKDGGGTMRKDKEGWYCNFVGQDCWGTIYEESYSGIHYEMVRIHCPFCETMHKFKEDESLKGTCECGATFNEGYDNIILFKRKKNGHRKREV